MARGGAQNTTGSNRLQEIVEVALELMRQKGYRDMTIQDLSEQMEFSKAAVYYYVKTKEELLYLIYDQSMDLLYGRIAPLVEAKISPLEKLRRVIFEYIDLVVLRYDAFAVFFMEKNNLTPEHHAAITQRERELVACLQRVYNQGVELGLFRPFHATAVVMGVLGMLAWLVRWYDPKGPLQPEVVAEQYFQMLAAGVLRAPAVGGGGAGAADGKES